MPEISANYASPNVRAALLREDFPGVEFAFRVGTAAEFGAPPSWGGDDEVVVCTITFPDASGRGPVSSYKEIVDVKGNRIPPEKRDTALWNVLSTKALGRACQRAGYPASLPELKALVLWRQRTAEIAALQSGHPIAALAPAPVEAALDAAAVPDPETTAVDDAPGPAGASSMSAGAYDELLIEYRRTIGLLGTDQPAFKKWCLHNGIEFARPDDDQIVDALTAARDALAGVQDAEVVGA